MVKIDGSKLLKAIPLDHVRTLAREALRKGVTVEDLTDELVALIDDLVDWRAILGEPWGSVLDSVDGPALRALVSLIVHQVQHEGA